MPHKHSRSALRSSTVVEDYLERILELINSKGYARVVDIAAALKISQASVTNMVQRLDAESLLKYEKYRGLISTAAGKSLAHSQRLGQALGRGGTNRLHPTVFRNVIQSGHRPEQFGN